MGEAFASPVARWNLVLQRTTFQVSSILEQAVVGLQQLFPLFEKGGPALPTMGRHGQQMEVNSNG